MQELFKILVKYVLARIGENISATEIVKSLDVLQAIRWVQESWRDVSSTTIKNCFEKCGFVKMDEELMEEDEENDEEFEELVRELTPDVLPSEYANFDANVQAFEPMINDQEIDWRERVRQEAINAVHNSKIPSTEILDENEDEIEGCDSDVDEENEKEEEDISCFELLLMLDKMQKCSLIDSDSQSMLSKITKKIEDIQIANRKQTTIRDFFSS